MSSLMVNFKVSYSAYGVAMCVRKCTITMFVGCGYAMILYTLCFDCSFHKENDVQIMGRLQFCLLN